MQRLLVGDLGRGWQRPRRPRGRQAGAVADGEDVRIAVDLQVGAHAQLLDMVARQALNVGEEARRPDPGSPDHQVCGHALAAFEDERSEEHTSELQSLMRISYAVFCLKKKIKQVTTSKNNKITSKLTEK